MTPTKGSNTSASSKTRRSSARRASWPGGREVTSSTRAARILSGSVYGERRDRWAIWVLPRRSFSIRSDEMRSAPS